MRETTELRRMLEEGVQGNGARLDAQECAAVLAALRPSALFVPVARVCGVDCHPGDAHCNNYCRDARVKEPPLFATAEEPPGMTDLMVSPEAIDAYLADHEPPDA